MQAPAAAVAHLGTALPPQSPAPEDLHPALWRAHQLGRSPEVVTASGFAALDAQLPGGGWPARALTELLLPHPGIGELRLLAPVLAQLQRQQRCVMWFDPPAHPCAWSLLALGIDLRQLVVVHAKQQLKSRARALLPAADILWALEQALKSGHIGAAVAWLPARLPADAVRRLQLAAQAHDGPVFLLRDAPHPPRHGPAAQLPPSAAPLRLLLTCAGHDVLRVSLVKRRGPPLAEPLLLALPPVLSVQARARGLALGLQHAAAAASTSAVLAFPFLSAADAGSTVPETPPRSPLPGVHRGAQPGSGGQTLGPAMNAVRPREWLVLEAEFRLIHRWAKFCASRAGAGCTRERPCPAVPKQALPAARRHPPGRIHPCERGCSQRANDPCVGRTAQHEGGAPANARANRRRWQAVPRGVGR